MAESSRSPVLINADFWQIINPKFTIHTLSVFLQKSLSGENLNFFSQKCCVGQSVVYLKEPRRRIWTQHVVLGERFMGTVSKIEQKNDFLPKYNLFDSIRIL